MIQLLMSMLKLLVVHDVVGLDKHLLISFLDYFECLNVVLWLRMEGSVVNKG